MQIINRFFRYSGITILGIVSLVSLLTTLVIVTQWNGVLLFLFGT